MAALVLKETAAARARASSSSNNGDINEYLTECNRILFVKAQPTNSSSPATTTTAGANTTAVGAHVVNCPTHRVPLSEVALQATHKVPWTSSLVGAHSLAIRPTIGSFAGYRRDCLLHIGIVDTRGRVYNFDERGRVCDESWPQAIHVPLKLEAKQTTTFDDDLLVHLMSEQQMNAFAPYHSMNNNCYSFVVRFLNGIKYLGRDDHTKESLVTTMIEKPMSACDMFVKITNELGSKPYFIIDAPLRPPSRFVCDFCRKELYAPDHYRCLECRDTDLCVSCANRKCENAEHKSTHAMQLQTGTAVDLMRATPGSGGTAIATATASPSTPPAATPSTTSTTVAASSSPAAAASSSAGAPVVAPRVIDLSLPSYQCDFCDKKRLQPGDHWRCTICRDVDLCRTCQLQQPENATHKNTHALRVM